MPFLHPQIFRRTYLRRVSCLALAIVGASSLAILSGCHRERNIEGQVFVVSVSRTNIKMGLVGVHVISREQLATIAPAILKSYLDAQERYEVRVAQCDRDRERLNELDQELQGLAVKDLNIEELTDLRLQVADAKTKLINSSQREAVDSLLVEGALARRFTDALPPAATKTDADGHFVAPAHVGDLLVAQDQRTQPGGKIEEYLWISSVQEKRETVLLANDSLVDDANLVKKLAEWNAVEVKIPPAARPNISKATEDFALSISKTAMAARAKALADVLENARSKYEQMLETVPINLLEKWGGEQWRRLKVEAGSTSNAESPLSRAAMYNESTKELNSLITTVVYREAEEKRVNAKIAADALEHQRIENEQIAAIAKAKADAEVAKNERIAQAEKEEREAKLEKLRSTPLFDDSVGATGGFRSFEYGFGFWVDATMSGYQLRVFVDGKTPKSSFNGRDADYSINIEERLNGSEQYRSNGHDFQIEWVKSSRWSWSAKVTVRRLN